ncbi:unnamed protein product [Urochloa humidicola]
MGSLTKLYHDWEIQLLVLLSFTIQIFLFFTGGLRRGRLNTFLRFSIWVAYLGADMVAVCALTYLSRLDDATIGCDTSRRAVPLSLFWAPFLLIHLGGQDTITAFAMEDNNLWLRHLLNLVIQVVLALYVLWNSIGRYSVDLLVSGIFMFVAGIIKYGERTWSLKLGSFGSLDSHGNLDHSKNNDAWLPPLIDGDNGYPNTVCRGLEWIGELISIFAAHRVGSPSGTMRNDRVLKVLEIKIALMYNYLYTKAPVLRRRGGIILRFISQISMAVAFVVFLTGGDRRIYSRTDIVITYSLFVGCFALEVCAMIILMASPWTWAWLKGRKYDRLARLSWFFFSSELIGWPEKRPLWSNALGQHNLSAWFGVGSEQRQPRSWSFSNNSTTLSRLLDTEYVKADGMPECLMEAADLLQQQGPKEWPVLGPFLRRMLASHEQADFGYTIVLTHVVTELHLRKYQNAVSGMEAAEANVLVGLCRKLSQYMMYLLVNHPSLLPLDVSVEDTLQRYKNIFRDYGSPGLPELDEPWPVGKKTLEEIKEAWMRLILYAAANSRPEMHAVLLARGGELLTIAWLMLAYRSIGNVGFFRITMTNISSKGMRTLYAFYFPEERTLQ